MNRFLKLFPLLMALTLVLAACNLPTGGMPAPDTGSPTVVILPSATPAAAQPTATNTLPPIVTATNAPTATQAAAQQATATTAPTATQSSSSGGSGSSSGGPGSCTNAATFVSDVTIPDDSTIPAGQAFVKTWRIRNDGTCTWGPTRAVRALAFTGGTKMGAPDQVALTGDVAPGKTVDLSVNFTAPTANGTYTSEWKLRLENGQSLGLGAGKNNPLFVRIKVGSAASGSTSRVRFAAGATAATVSGDLKANETKGFVVAAMSQQVLLAEVTSGSGQAKVKVSAADGRSLAGTPNPNGGKATAVLPSSQDYTVWVTAGDQATSFSLAITIPSRIAFDKGAVSDTVDGKVRSRWAVSYVLWAKSGQTMTVKLDTANLALTIYGLTDGQVLVKSDSGSGSWSGTLPASQDYIIVVVPSVDSADFKMEVTIK